MKTKLNMCVKVKYENIIKKKINLHTILWNDKIIKNNLRNCIKKKKERIANLMPRKMKCKKKFQHYTH